MLITSSKLDRRSDAKSLVSLSKVTDSSGNSAAQCHVYGRANWDVNANPVGELDGHQPNSAAQSGSKPLPVLISAKTLTGIRFDPQQVIFHRVQVHVGTGLLTSFPGRKRKKA